MKIYEGNASYKKLCRLCDKPICVKHIILEFNSTQKAFFHHDCWKKFKDEIKNYKTKEWCDRCEDFYDKKHECFGGWAKAMAKGGKKE